MFCSTAPKPENISLSKNILENPVSFLKDSSIPRKKGRQNIAKKFKNDEASTKSFRTNQKDSMN